jgi:hypothetical protein
MDPINPTLRNMIVEFLMPLSVWSDARSRQALLLAAGLDPILGQVNLEGNPQQVALLLVNTLAHYGQLETGEWALCAFLQTVAQQVGMDKQQIIRCWCDQIARPTTSTASIPSISANAPDDMTTVKPASSQIFICYAPEDRATILTLAQTLRTYGLNIWLADEQIEVGDPTRERIAQALQGSQFLLVCLSRYFNRSFWCHADYQTLLLRIVTTQNPVVLPVLVGDCDETEMPTWLYDKYCVDARTAVGLERVIRKLKPMAANSTVATKQAQPLPELLQTELPRLQEKLLRLAQHQTATDQIIIDFDGLGAEFLALVLAFPDYFEHFHELITAYQNVAENLLTMITEAEYRRVLTVHVREFEQTIEDVASDFKYGESFLTHGVVDDSPYGLSSKVFDQVEIEQWMTMLLSGDELDESEALDWLLKEGFAETLKRLQRIPRRETLDAVLHVLWKRFPRIFLYYRQNFWEMVKYMLECHPLRWKLRFHAVRIFLRRSLTAQQALDVLQNFMPTEQHILSAFLMLHPKQECRSVCLERLPPADRWDILLGPGVPWLIIKELVIQSCRDASESYVKALFLLLRPRLLKVDNPLAIAQAYHILTMFYHVPVFLQETFFQALIATHKEIGTHAQQFSVTREFEEQMCHLFRSFCSQPYLQDVDIAEMTHIPLPIQRKLAHDGYLPKYFVCNVRDVIALETVRHIERRPDVVTFFRLKRINPRALEKLADNKLLMSDYQVRSAFCHNPKANPVLIRTYLSTLTRREIKELSIDKNVNAYTRELAGKYLNRYN